MKPPVGQGLSIGVICTVGSAHVSRCLAALRAQRDAPPFDIVVACDEPAGMDAVRQAFPDVLVVDSGGTGPMGLVSRALGASRGDLVLLTKDHCMPGPDWVRTMVNAQASGRAAVGGRVEAPPDASPWDWAFYFIDFHAYAAPVAEGATSRLSVCNVSYVRDRLEAIADDWRHTFVERDVHDRLAARFGSLWMCTASEVTFARPLTPRQAVAERYAYGRLFGYSRMRSWSPAKRAAYAVLAPALPAVLLSRLVRAALQSRRQTRALVRGAVPLVLMVLGRSLGEFVAYTTGRPPRGLARPDANVIAS